MADVKVKYSKLFVTCVFCLLTLISFSQEKSADIKTINGKKYYIHKVEKGQSLYAISKLYNVDINVILGENDEAIDGLRNGQELKIPVSGAATTIQPIHGSPIDTIRYGYHKVEKKETVFAICKKYNLTEAQLTQWNPSIPTAGIKAGQMLIISEKKKVLTNATTVTLADSVVKISKPKKTKYNIGLLLPFKIAESELLDVSNLVASKSNFPQVQSLAIDFLMGYNKAVDSLKSADFSIQTFLYDIDDKDSNKVTALCKNAEFKSLDLIIGPAYPSGFKDVSTYAKANNIPVISPFTQQSKILFKNNISSKVNPSQYTMIEALADYCIDSLKSASVFIVNNGNIKDQQYVKAFKQMYNEHLKELNYPAKDSVIEVRGLAGSKASYVPGKKNVYVLLSNNQVYLTDYVTQLAVFSDKKDITLAGWQNITNTENIDQEYLNRVSYTFPSQNNLINIKAYSNLIKSYQMEMSSDPSDYFFQGFDLAQYYLQNLKTGGPDFINQLDKLQSEGNYLRFKFYRPDENTGFENKGVYIFKYNNYQLYRTAWK